MQSAFLWLLITISATFTTQSAGADPPVRQPEIGGYNVTTDWPKLGPFLLIATALVLAIRTAKWPATFSRTTVNPELDAEIEYAAYLASRVLSSLVAKREGLFPQNREPWYQPSDEDVQK